MLLPPDLQYLLQLGGLPLEQLVVALLLHRGLRHVRLLSLLLESDHLLQHVLPLPLVERNHVLNFEVLVSVGLAQFSDLLAQIHNLRHFRLIAGLRVVRVILFQLTLELLSLGVVLIVPALSSPARFLCCLFSVCFLFSFFGISSSFEAQVAPLKLVSTFKCLAHFLTAGKLYESDSFAKEGLWVPNKSHVEDSAKFAKMLANFLLRHDKRKVAHKDRSLEIVLRLFVAVVRVDTDVLFHEVALVESKSFGHALLVFKQDVGVLVVFLHAEVACDNLGAFGHFGVLGGGDRTEPQFFDGAALREQLF